MSPMSEMTAAPGGHLQELLVLIMRRSNQGVPVTEPQGPGKIGGGEPEVAAVMVGADDMLLEVHVLCSVHHYFSLFFLAAFFFSGKPLA